MNKRNDGDFDWQEQVGAQPLRLRPKNPRLSILMGYLVSQLVGFGALALVTLIFSNFNFAKLGDLGSWTAGILGFSQFFLIPFGMGVVATYFWMDTAKVNAHATPEANNRTAHRGMSGSTFLNTLLACLGAFFVLREGAVCLLMASPVLWVFMWMGVLAGAHFWRKNPFLGVSLVPIFLMLIFAEASRPQTQAFQVSTDFHSAAPPAALWKYAANYPANPHPATGWLFRLGLPAPRQATGQAVVGGRRDCELDGGIRVGQKIVTAEPNRKLEFVIDEQPQHPEITHHFVLERGRIDFLPDGKGGTVLRGTSWYRLNVAPLEYFNGWGAQAIHQTHHRVFAWMDELARREG